MLGDQIGESLRLHRGLSRRAARDRAVELLRQVGIPDAETRVRAYPHEFSGGMQQRAMIGMGLMGTPALIVADEPTTALDVTVQAQILNLIKDLKSKYGMAVILITHDLTVVRKFSDYVYVMQHGEMCEHNVTERLFANPQHPYTRALLAAMPSLDPNKRTQEAPITGDPPNPIDPPPGCRFHTRCPLAEARCRVEVPPMKEVAPGHYAACHLRPGREV